MQLTVMASPELKLNVVGTSSTHSPVNNNNDCNSLDYSQRKNVKFANNYYRIRNGVHCKSYKK